MSGAKASGWMTGTLMWMPRARGMRRGRAGHAPGARGANVPSEDLVAQVCGAVASGCLAGVPAVRGTVRDFAGPCGAVRGRAGPCSPPEGSPLSLQTIVQDAGVGWHSLWESASRWALPHPSPLCLQVKPFNSMTCAGVPRCHAGCPAMNWNGRTPQDEGGYPPLDPPSSPSDV